MKKPFKNIILKIALSFLLLAITSLLIQKSFYPIYVDAQGLLHETLWTPIAAFSFMLSVASFVVYLILLIFKLIKRWIK
jgi:Ca2+/H+ antiporter